MAKEKENKEFQKRVVGVVMQDGDEVIPILNL